MLPYTPHCGIYSRDQAHWASHGGRLYQTISHVHMTYRAHIPYCSTYIQETEHTGPHIGAIYYYTVYSVQCIIYTQLYHMRYRAPYCIHVAYIQETGHSGPDTGADFWQVTMGWLLQLEPHFQIWRIFTINMMLIHNNNDDIHNDHDDQDSPFTKKQSQMDAGFG